MAHGTWHMAHGTWPDGARHDLELGGRGPYVIYVYIDANNMQYQESIGLNCYGMYTLMKRTEA
jgi:hypothetical protein